MTKKDYIKFAKMIRDARETLRQLPTQTPELAAGHTQAVDHIRNQIAHIFSDDNANFDLGRFLEACGK